MGVFEEIYDKNSWGWGSGGGSLPSVTKKYREFLEDFLRNNSIKSVVDYGCGDWQFSKLINWSGIKYTGFDIVSKVIERDKKLYGTKSIHFETPPSNARKLPKADLFLSKDVFQHISNEEVLAICKVIKKKYKYALITNDILPSSATKINDNIKTGTWRAIDLRLKPFSMNAIVVFSYTVPPLFSAAHGAKYPASEKLVMLIH